MTAARAAVDEELAVRRADAPTAVPNLLP